MGGAAALALLLAGCASSPSAIYRMTPEEIGAVSSPALCQAYATARRDRESHPVLDSEVRSRGLGCEQELSHTVSDCSELEVVSTESVARGIIVAVRNNGGSPRHFRVAVNGVAAGLSTTSNKIGFVAAKPIPSVLSNINSVLLGARSVNPDATVQVIFTGEWSLPVREAEAANALVDAGADVLTCHVDSPKVVIETAEGRGVKSCGHNASQRPLAPKGFITGAEYKWETIYKIYADALAAGEELPNFIAGGYHNDMLRNTAYGAGASEAAIKAADAAIAALKAGEPIYVGPLKDNKGNTVIETTMDNYDPVLDGMDYLLEGVQGSTT